MPRARTTPGVDPSIMAAVPTFVLVTKTTYVDEALPGTTFGIVDPQLRKNDPDDSAEKVVIGEFDSSQTSIRSIFLPVLGSRTADGGIGLTSGDVKAIDIRCVLLKSAISAASLTYTAYSAIAVDVLEQWTDTMEDDAVNPIDQPADADAIDMFSGGNLCFHRSAGPLTTGPYFGFAIFVASMSGQITPVLVTQTIESQSLVGREPRVLTS